MKEAHLMFMVDPDNTLAEAWEELAAGLLEAGAQSYQIEAMKMTFFMGAAQVHMTVHANSRGSRDQFVAMMDSLQHDLTAALPRQRTIPSRGNA